MAKTLVRKCRSLSLRVCKQMRAKKITLNDLLKDLKNERRRYPNEPLCLCGHEILGPHDLTQAHRSQGHTFPGRT